ncbi:4-galactosyl-N-acetylglucosaminide 3-alpha-L-fucosyltransferase 9-like [Convolutriloba macropyga]|uniref:4-galactosyl-N-acetylglucosaminide 3-alpha-L-fucosyltransferase 9-like n=1 Tax=Convolutriloba macropyga TaxID=536237 RepID=UPI003F51BFA7
MGSLSSKVHIWGAATQKGCVNGKHPNVVDHGLTTEGQRSRLGVPQTLLKDCKFYFAFENSNCTDFLTTRFITSVVAGAVPIVMGRMDNYDEMPPGSFVHLSHFATISQLAKHLDLLSKNEKELSKYHEWRKFYRYEQTGAEAACELCHKLEKLKRAQTAGEKIIPSIIPNLAKHYEELQKCTPIKSPPI